MRRLLAFVAAIYFGTFSVLARAQADTVPSAVNLAGEQRMLTQRIARLYSQIGLNVMPGPAVSQLTMATNRFERNMEALKRTVAGSPEAVSAHARLGLAWSGMKQAVTTAVSRDSAEALAQQADATLAAAERLVKVIVAKDKSAASQVVNLAGRQRMLSQRIAAIYLLRSWGVESRATRENLAAAVKEFSSVLNGLRARSDNSEAIRMELEEVAQQWEWLQASLSVEGAGAYRLIVAESADAILDATDRITSLYEQQSAR